jgi:hypothetical protein
VDDRISAALRRVDLPSVADGKGGMSLAEQCVHAFIAAVMLAASLALSDPQLGLAGAFKRSPVNEYVLQSCPER